MKYTPTRQLYEWTVQIVGTLLALALIPILLPVAFVARILETLRGGE